MRKTLPHTIKTLAMILLFFFTTIVLSSEKSIYRNTEFGFTFEYPNTYQLQEGGGGTLIDLDGNNGTDGYILELDECIEKNRYIFMVLFWRNKFRSCAIDIARSWCESEGPFGESYCTSVKREIRYKNKHGVPIIQLQFVNIHKDYETGTKEERILGPTFIVDITKDPNHQTALIFGLASSRLMDKARFRLIKDVVSTVSLAN